MCRKSLQAWILQPWFSWILPVFNVANLRTKPVETGFYQIRNGMKNGKIDGHIWTHGHVLKGPCDISRIRRKIERESIIAAFGPLQSVVPKTRYPWISAKLQAEEVAIHPSRIIQGLIDLTEVAVTAALLDSGLEFSKSSSSDGQ